jgi:hypothetical protein
MCEYTREGEWQSVNIALFYADWFASSFGHSHSPTHPLTLTLSRCLATYHSPHYPTYPELSDLFRQHDKDHSGALDAHELACLCDQLGCSLSLAELESALLLLDADGSGGVR